MVLKYKIVVNVIVFFVLFLSTNAQYNNSQILELQSDNTKTDFYHLTNFGNTEKKSIPFIAQDSTGQMWFATKDGLIRYDAQHFYHYNYNPDNVHSIGGNFIERIFVGHDGNVFIGTEPGVLAKYRPEKDDFIRIEGISGKRIKDIKQDANGLYWITSDKKLYSYNDKTKQVTTYTYPDDKVGLDRLLITSSGQIFVTTNEHYILEFFPDKKSFKTIEIIPRVFKKHRSNTTAYSAFYLIEDAEHFIWITTPYGFLVRYNPKNQQKTKFVYEDLKQLNKLDWHKLTVMFIMEDKEQQLWLGTWFNGMYKMDKNRTRITHFMPDDSNPNSLTNNIIHSGFQDKAGYLWFGTEFAGINILKKNKKFEVINYQDNTLPDTFINTVVDNNKVWVLDYVKGLYSFNRNNPYKISNENQRFDVTGKTPFFTEVFLDSRKNLWLGREKGIYVYNFTSHKYQLLQHINNDFTTISSNVALSFAEDKDQSIWIGTNHGLNKYNPETKKIIRFLHNKDNPKSLSNNIVKTILCDSENNVWIGTRGGLNMFEKQTGNFIIYQHDDDNKQSLPDNIINDIEEIGNYLWLATKSGLVRFNKNTKQFKLLTRKGELPENYIKSLVVDDKGFLWAASPHHLYKIDTPTMEITSYGKSDGLEAYNKIADVGKQELQFVSANAYKDKNGFLYFGGLAGMTIFYPDSLAINTYQAPVYVTSIKVNGEERGIDDSIELKPEEQQITIKTNILNYIQPNKNQYAFYLENYDSIWHYTGQKNSYTYYNLPKGKYQLHYKAANNDNIWTENSKVIQLRILPHFYETKLFYSLLALFLLLLMGLFFAQKIWIKRKIKKQKESLKYSSSSLSEQEIERINRLLEDKLNTSKLYLESNLTLHKLAGEIEVTPNHLSQVINRKHQRNFNDYINLYRLKDAIHLLTTTQLKIEAVAYDSGFNSLSTFNAFFKKEMQMTPSKYRKEHKE